MARRAAVAAATAGAATCIWERRGRAGHWLRRRHSLRSGRRCQHRERPRQDTIRATCPPTSRRGATACG
jgi:hypothetical protein